MGVGLERTGADVSVLDDAKVYVDLPKKMQDDDALRFARAVIYLYERRDQLIEALREACDWADGSGDKFREYGLRPEDEDRIAVLRRIAGRVPA
jgi:hypothetical protein